MDWFWRAIDWFAGGERHYMTLYHCMSHDTLWVAITVLLDVAVAAGYTLIALHWWRNQKSLQPGEARDALGRMRNIFIFCGLCGYLFIPVKMVWPAWRLYDIILVVLVYYTWRYAWNARDLKVVYHELRRSQALATELAGVREESRRKTFFLNALGHDLKNPLYGLGLQAEVAGASLASGDPDTARQALAMIRRCTYEANALLESFLELGRLDWHGDEPSCSPFDYAEVIRTLTAANEPAAVRKGLRLTVNAPPQLWLNSDRAKVERIASNLLSNALKYTDQGQVQVSLSRNGQGVVLEVADTGPGIPPEEQEHVFDEFYQIHNRARERGKGHGLGLAIARRLVEHLGGKIVLESEVGRGSRFRVVLPDAPTDGPTDQPQERQLVST